jgi:hypothetical protein
LRKECIDSRIISGFWVKAKEKSGVRDCAARAQIFQDRSPSEIDQKSSKIFHVRSPKHSTAFIPTFSSSFTRIPDTTDTNEISRGVCHANAYGRYRLATRQALPGLVALVAEFFAWLQPRMVQP